MLSFEDLGAGDWEKYGDSILQSEGVFPEGIRTPKEDFIEVLDDGDGVAKVALMDSAYVGNVFGYRIAPDDFEYYGLHDVPKDAKIIYLFNIVVNPDYQGKGYGKRLLWEFIKAAKAKGYGYVAGHFRQNGSLKLIKAFGAKEEGVCRNWENIGEDCVACCLDIHNLSDDDFKPSGEGSGLMPVAPAQEQPEVGPAIAPDATPGLHPEMIDPSPGVPCEPAPAMRF
jgi:GNAT superfamily N-acetyltransferase